MYLPSHSCNHTIPSPHLSLTYTPLPHTLQLPVLVILRLCTSEKQVVEYWNNIDQQLELDIDVLDDQYGDAAEVNTHNPWLTYGEPLHR